MTYVLNRDERTALLELSRDHEIFFLEDHFPSGVTASALDALVALGLAEKGEWFTSGAGKTGYRITDDGWRCMYGKTADEIVKGDATLFPLRVWRWPPEGQP